MVIMVIVQVALCLIVLVVPRGFAFTTTTTPAALYKSQYHGQHHGYIRSVSRSDVPSRRLYTDDKDDDETGEGAIDPFPELIGLEQARASLQDVFKGQFLREQDGTTKSTGMIQQPILTETGRHRRQLEMDLIASLADSNDAVDELVHLWIYETGDLEAAVCIIHMEESCSVGLVSEVQDLQSLVAQYPAWAEPRVRLAFVLYYKGHLEESRVAALEALECKPWHFEAVELLIMMALRQKDMVQASYWARRCALPNLRTVVGSSSSSSSSSSSADNTAAAATPPAGVFHKRRRVWVERALRDAELQWQDAERVTQEVYRESYAVEPSFANEQVWQ